MRLLLLSRVVVQDGWLLVVLQGCWVDSHSNRLEGLSNLRMLPIHHLLLIMAVAKHHVPTALTAAALG